MANVTVPLGEIPLSGGAGDLPVVVTNTEDTYTVPNRPGLALSVKIDGETGGDITFQTSASLLGFQVADHVVSQEPGPGKVYGRFPVHVFGGEIRFTTSVPCTVQAYV